MSRASKAQRFIAVVDDDVRVCKALQRLMRSSGFSVRTFNSGEELLAILDDYKPDCVLLDLHMPNGDGFEVLSRLRQTNSSIPAIVFTGDDIPESRIRSLGNGAKAYLCKPVDEEVLLKAVNAAMAP